MTKRKFGLGLSLMLAAGTMLAACGSDEDTTTDKTDEGKGGEETADFSVAMVTDVGGVDDKSFNQSAWEGLQQFGEENGLKKGDGGFDYLQSASDADYNTNLNNLIRRDFDVVYGIGFLMEGAVKEIAEQQPEAQIAIVDAVVDAPNVASVLFKEQEGAFLAGVAAALMSETKKIGFVGGMEIPVIERFEAGFLEGVAAVDDSIKVDVQYTGAFDKAELGKTTANRMYSAGADIIFHAAGGTGNGVFTEAKERKEANPDDNIWVIGVDADQYDEGQTGDANVTLTSVLKRVDTAVINISEQAMAGEFPGGETVTYGLADEGVGLADSRGAIPEDVMKKIEEFQKQVIDGDIEVPETVK
ncbi:MULTISPECIES: BMP family protein [Planococcus]|uniref:BMP family ABC transporter substrate-binding protein n=1 Tax=Planococcus faecalis TaxID=1598147 RepID=A0ABM6ITE1_9BACL|nr:MULTISPECIES: BMP family protein [Planococcus]AQU79792.1 BMP family ABC transporter substrate-binding protein [Planococcus faecalis]MDJ0331770.1 BMP family protein [Planococcus sp. S3-L1]OHX52642.1 BMP family ABC transporter substrate-binding protein [Planococcus faecalis]